MQGSFRNYGKVDPYLQFQYETKRKERRRIFTIVGASVFLVIAIICVTVGVVVRKHSSSSNSSSTDDSPQFSSGSMAIQAACNATRFPDTCVESFNDNPESLTANPLQLVTLGVKIALSKTAEAYDLSLELAKQAGLNPLELMALQDCSELLGNTLDYLNSSITQLLSLDVKSLQKTLENIEVLLSTASSEQTACTDNFFNISGSAKDAMFLKQQYVDEILINAVCLVETLAELGTDLSSWKKVVSSIPNFHLRRLLSTEEDHESRLAHWASMMERELQAAPAPNSTSGIDLVVAKDGTGHYKTLKAALDAVPEDYEGRYVIYIKAGEYDEGPFNISKVLKGLTLIGDGCNKTIITGDANVAKKGYTTYRSATVGVAAKGFLARYITFKNTAGPEGHQAVALRANAENVVFDSCCFDGYQDTLYPLSGMQFYKSCKIIGTVDFVFGNALAVFQNCDLVARLPDKGQQITYTAQGRKDKALVTGFSFQNCSLIQDEDLKNASFVVNTYLGRPWKAYSTTVFLQSYYGPHINPSGWLYWNDSHPHESTCFYGEYMNNGPGASVTARVPWEGVHPALSTSEASKYTVNSVFPNVSFIPSDIPVKASL
ncbi:hypothetical protein GOP47_0026671 [Adiantum capillus-veneris]|nr:hypothetical protein GOP47_0026671 [Adiantum capillus-veneris]